MLGGYKLWNKELNRELGTLVSPILKNYHQAVKKLSSKSGEKGRGQMVCIRQEEKLNNGNRYFTIISKISLIGSSIKS